MASLITTVSHGAYPQQPRKALIAMQAFQNDLFSYTVSQNSQTYVTTGTLSAPVAGANASTCPKGRVLNANGKKLFPGANPGVSTYMIGVYDPVTGLNGYVDPSSAAFTPMASDKNPQNQQFDANGNIVYGIDPNTGDSDKAQPVYTLGNGYFGGSVDISGNLTVDVDGYFGGNVDISGNLTVDGDGVITGDVDISGALVVDNTITATSDILTNGGVIGYASTPGAVTQLTDKATAVTLNAPTGVITMSGANLNNATNVTFTFNNSFITTGDIIVINSIDGNGPLYTYAPVVTLDGVATITVRNISGGNRTDALQLRYAIIRV